MKRIYLIFALMTLSITSNNTLAGSVILGNNTPGYVSLESVTFAPDPATNFRSITATISGLLGNPGYTVSAVTEIIPEDNNQILIEVFSFTPKNGDHATVLDPFTVVADMDLLAAGIYEVTVDLFLDGKVFTSMTSKLEVSAVPLPAAAWLLLCGLVSLFAFGKNKQVVLLSTR